ncbi:hypothetical protein ACKWTF_015889 [Chironomus riparius]
MSKTSPNLLQTITNSTACLILTLMFIFLTICPQQTSQQAIISKSSVIQSTCIYSYILNNIYSCELQISESLNSMDVLEITGIHLDNQTDADVQIVNYQSIATSYFNGEVLKKFKNLKVLNFYGSGLQAINPNSFVVCSSLETITGLFNQITLLPSEMLKNCENLKAFRLEAYNIFNIPENLFGMTKNLEDFRLTTFNITSLPEKLLQNIKNLTIFDISGNKLTELHPNFLIAAVNLEEVDMSFNNFEDQRKLTYALNGHPNLKKLYLSYNSFKNFDFRFFAQFQMLETLKIGISYQNFTGISWKSLPSSLLYLTVDGIDEELGENSFDHLVNLKSLVLSGSGIEYLHKDTFKALTNLETMEIILTNIKFLHPELFMNLINLSDLNLGYNRIEELPAGIFAPLVNLGIKSDFHGIKMNSNKIERLNAKSFGLHPHLRHLTFYQNIINEIEHGIFRKFNPNLFFVDLQSNKCIDGSFSGENLDDNEAFSLCHKNWNEIVPTTSTTTEATTPGSAGNSFKKFEIFVVIFIGFVKVLMNFVD